MSEEKSDPFQFERDAIERFLPSPLANISASYLAKKYDAVFIPVIPVIDKDSEILSITNEIVPITNKLFLYLKDKEKPRVYDVNTWEYKEIDVELDFLKYSRSPYSNKLVIWGEKSNGFNKLILIDGDRDIFQIIPIEDHEENEGPALLGMFDAVTWLEGNEYVSFSNEFNIEFDLVKLDDVDQVKYLDGFKNKQPSPISLGILFGDYHGYKIFDPISELTIGTRLDRRYERIGMSWLKKKGKIATLKKDGSFIEFPVDVHYEDFFSIVRKNLLHSYSEYEDEPKKSILFRVDGSSLNVGETVGDYLFLIDEDMFFRDIETEMIYTIDVNTGERKVPKRINEEMKKLVSHITHKDELYITKLTNNSIIIYTAEKGGIMFGFE